MSNLDFLKVSSNLINCSGCGTPLPHFPYCHHKVTTLSARNFKFLDTFGLIIEKYFPKISSWLFTI